MLTCSRSVGDANLLRNYARFGGRLLNAFDAVGHYFGVLSVEAPDLAVKKSEYRTMIEEL